ncbi:hypothetical protein [Haladaptatus sp. DYF46]|uniref:hypothetical protein n=1 Tax=Haladaptatus sp. DYF46 TaxID=2886041 RepID=UPI001E57B7F4|nr:hypothetical protein [Haladaptatus sp. DYF46]
MRRQLLGFLSISFLVLLVVWAVTAVALKLHLIESPLLENAVLLVTGIFCALGLLLYCWRGVRWLRFALETGA